MFTQREWPDDEEEVKDSIKQTVKDMSMADFHDTIETFKEDIDQQDQFSRYKRMVDRMKFMIDVAFEAFGGKRKLDKHPNQASMCLCHGDAKMSGLLNPEFYTWGCLPTGQIHQADGGILHRNVEEKGAVFLGLRFVYF